MQGYFDCMRLDLEGAVDVLAASPGPVATSIHAIPQEQLEPLTTPAPVCARMIREAIEKGKRDRLVMPLRWRLATKLYPFVPALMDKGIVRASRRFYMAAAINARPK